MRFLFTTICCLFLLPVLYGQQKDPEATIYVDKKGVMRWADSHREASFFGVNYTLPFAHAYRAIQYTGKDHKEAIDKDVYHMARLGFNGYRIHIWDVEISDQYGNLIENDYLDLLDYLIAQLKERNIKTVITAMTNFGNGYPERNQPTGGFSYLYDKCDIHDNPEAIRAQQNYISSLVNHLNPYTGKKYRDDPDIVGFEINNEPCHAGTQAQTRSYINKMVQAIRKTGNKKPVFYNVSHNMQQLDAYYTSPIQGTTYQWYPIGLVAGHTRYGNFLPYVENYHIPFSTLKGFDNKAKLIYEFDPADIMYSYMYPATTRAFRSAGFQWITQFAYDPVDIAWANTEYQTHFLNLAYTPQKAISMRIAAEVAYNTPLYATFESYPADTVFGDFRVSYKEDLSELNAPDKFYYSNHTTTRPVEPESLRHIAGYGNSPVVRYEGTGAYFLDKLENGIWRLELMPDAIQVKDPFERPSLQKEVVTILWGKWDMKINLPDLGDKFEVTVLNKGNSYSPQAVTNGTLPALQPGVYLLTNTLVDPVENRQAEDRWENIRLGEFVAPQPHCTDYIVNHSPAQIAEAGKPLAVKATIAGPAIPDSVLIYTDKVSFWNRSNPYTLMERENGYNYSAVLPAETVNKGSLNYHIVIYRRETIYTFPEGIHASPLDWDYTGKAYYHADLVPSSSPLLLFNPLYDQEKIESYIIPESWNVQKEVVDQHPTAPTLLRFTFRTQEENPTFFLRAPVKNKISNRTESLPGAEFICMQAGNLPANVEIGFITSDGYTYKAPVKAEKDSVVKVPVRDMQQTATALLPHAYPTFLDKYFIPKVRIPFRIQEIEQLEISFTGTAGEGNEIEIGTIWLE